MTLIGRDFGAKHPNHMVFVDGDQIPASAIFVYNHTFIMFRMPPGLGNRNLTVSVAGQVPEVNPRTAMHFFPPLLLALTPNMTGTDGGAEIELLGANFGTPDLAHVAKMHVKFHRSVCTLLSADCSREDLCDCTVLTHSHERIVIRCVVGVKVLCDGGIAGTK